MSLKNRARRKTVFSVLWTSAVLACFCLIVLAPFGGSLKVARADGTAQAIPFTQNWTNTGLITTNDDWSGVPGIIGYLGDDPSTTTGGTDPQTILTVGLATVDVIANQTNPNTLVNGGVAEFEIANPVVALNGSGTADAPHIVIHVNTTGHANINVTYNLSDIDGSIDNAIQPVALQYRVGGAGNYVNVPAGFVADATTGPSQATLVTPVNVTLPAACDNQPLVQLRIMTYNAVGNDEWVGIDDINIGGGTTAASFSLAGRVTNINASAVSAAQVVMTDQTGGMRYTRTSPFGYFRFTNVEAGQTYIVSVSHKLYQFAPQVVFVTEELNELNFVPLK